MRKETGLKSHLLTFNALVEVIVSIIVGGGISKALSIYLPGGKKHSYVSNNVKINSETTDTSIDKGDTL